MQIINTVEGDNNRFTLAKMAYNRITDPVNFTQVYSLVSSNAIRDDLSSFIRNQAGSGMIASYSETFRTGMSNQTLDALLINVKTNLDPSTRANMVTEIINNQTNYFTADQVRRLLVLVEFEGTRLQLLKNVFTHVIDRENYALLYPLLSTDIAKIELINHVKTAAENGGLANYNLTKPVMNDERFTKLLINSKEAFAAGNGTDFITRSFTDIGDYFSAQQAIQLIGMLEGDLPRLSMAKTVYKNITDPFNFLVLMDNLLYSPVTKNELNIYAYSYRPL